MIYSFNFYTTSSYPHIFQILSDEALRANYDASGKDSVESAPKVDPSTLFAMIFGSEKFVPLVGEY